jgi:hypothetical protein
MCSMRQGYSRIVKGFGEFAVYRAVQLNPRCTVSTPTPSLKGSLHWKVKEASARAGLETHTPNNLVVSGARLISQ